MTASRTPERPSGGDARLSDWEICQRCNGGMVKRLSVRWISPFSDMFIWHACPVCHGTAMQEMALSEALGGANPFDYGAEAVQSAECGSVALGDDLREVKNAV